MCRNLLAIVSQGFCLVPRPGGGLICTSWSPRPQPMGLRVNNICWLPVGPGLKKRALCHCPSLELSHEEILFHASLRMFDSVRKHRSHGSGFYIPGSYEWDHEYGNYSTGYSRDTYVSYNQCCGQGSHTKDGPKDGRILHSSLGFITRQVLAVADI